MKEVKTRKRYKCDYCNRRSTKEAMERHEKICFRNPKRYCDYCDNKGFTMEDMGIDASVEQDCPYCKNFDKKMLKEIKAREKIEKPDNTKIKDIPL